MGVVLLHDLKETFPVGHRLGLHQVKFIRERPPDVAIGPQPRHDIAQVALIGGLVHPSEIPPVIRVEQNQIRFDAQVAQLAHALLEVLEEGRVETREVPTL